MSCMRQVFLNFRRSDISSGCRLNLFPSCSFRTFRCKEPNHLCRRPLKNRYPHLLKNHCLHLSKYHHLRPAMSPPHPKTHHLTMSHYYLRSVNPNCSPMNPNHRLISLNHPLNLTHYPMNLNCCPKCNGFRLLPAHHCRCLCLLPTSCFPFRNNKYPTAPYSRQTHTSQWMLHLPGW